MEEYFKRKSTGPSSPLKKSNNSYERYAVEVKLKDLPADFGLRIRIHDYNCNIWDEVRRAYLQKGLCQPWSHTFHWRNVGHSQKGLVQFCLLNILIGWNIVF